MAASLLILAGCNKINHGNASPFDAVGMHPESIEQLHKYQVNDAEVQQILAAGSAGMTEQDCVELVRIARSRDRVFAEGDIVAGLLGAGVKESTIMELVRLDELNGYGGEAEAMHLANLSDEVILDVARRRVKGEKVLSGARLAELRDAGFSNSQLVAELDRGITDQQAQQVIAHHDYAAGGHSFVHQPRRR